MIVSCSFCFLSFGRSPVCEIILSVWMNSCPRAHQHMKREKIPHVLINLGMFPVIDVSFHYTLTLNRAVCLWSLAQRGQKSGHLVEWHLCAHGGSVGWQRLQWDGSRMAADKQRELALYPGRARSPAGWLSACRSGWPPSLPLGGRRERRTRGGWSRREEEGVKSLCRCCLSHFLSLYFFCPCGQTQTGSLLLYTHAFTQCCTHTYWDTLWLFSVLWCASI